MRRLVDRAHARGLTTEVVAIGGSGDGQQLLARAGASPGDLTVVVTRSGRVLHDPTEEDLAREL